MDLWEKKIVTSCPIHNFEGGNNAYGGLPPDTNGDVGYDPDTSTKYYMQWNNTFGGEFRETSLNSNQRLFIVIEGENDRISSMIRYMSKRVNKENRPVIYYIHPREIDPNHPRLQMGWKRKFKSYINLKSTLPKLKNLLSEQNITSFSHWLMEYDEI